MNFLVAEMAVMFASYNNDRSKVRSVSSPDDPLSSRQLVGPLIKQTSVIGQIEDKQRSVLRSRLKSFQSLPSKPINQSTSQTNLPVIVKAPQSTHRVLSRSQSGIVFRPTHYQSVLKPSLQFLNSLSAPKPTPLTRRYSVDSGLNAYSNNGFDGNIFRDFNGNDIKRESLQGTKPLENNFGQRLNNGNWRNRRMSECNGSQQETRSDDVADLRKFQKENNPPRTKVAEIEIQNSFATRIQDDDVFLDPERGPEVSSGPQRRKAMFEMPARLEDNYDFTLARVDDSKPSLTTESSTESQLDDKLESSGDSDNLNHLKLEAIDVPREGDVSNCVALDKIREPFDNENQLIIPAEEPAKLEQMHATVNIRNVPVVNRLSAEHLLDDSSTFDIQMDEIIPMNGTESPLVPAPHVCKNTSVELVSHVPHAQAPENTSEVHTKPIETRIENLDMSKKLVDSSLENPNNNTKDPETCPENPDSHMEIPKTTNSSTLSGFDHTHYNSSPPHVNGFVEYGSHVKDSQSQQQVNGHSLDEQTRFQSQKQVNGHSLAEHTVIQSQKQVNGHVLEDPDWLPIDLIISKSYTGLGFCIEGGCDSIEGKFKPITIKRIFKGMNHLGPFGVPVYIMA